MSAFFRVTVFADVLMVAFRDVKAAVNKDGGAAGSEVHPQTI